MNESPPSLMHKLLHQPCSCLKGYNAWQRKGSSTKCSRLIFSSSSELLPSCRVIRQIRTSRHFLSTQTTTRRSDDRVRVYAKSYSRWSCCHVKLAENGNYIISEIYLSPEIWQQELHHIIGNLFVTGNMLLYWLEGYEDVCLASSQNKWHIKTCYSLTKLKHNINNFLVHAKTNRLFLQYLYICLLVRDSTNAVK